MILNCACLSEQGDFSGCQYFFSSRHVCSDVSVNDVLGERERERERGKKRDEGGSKSELVLLLLRPMGDFPTNTIRSFYLEDFLFAN